MSARIAKSLLVLVSLGVVAGCNTAEVPSASPEETPQPAEVVAEEVAAEESTVPADPDESPVPEAVSLESRVAGAVAAAPEDRRAGATVLGYDEAGDLVELRAGSNELTCIADTPGDEQFRVACYHQSLEPYMARGRELRLQGIDGAKNLEQRHLDADEGRLEMPASPASVYNLGGGIEIFDPATGAVEGGFWVWSVYTPYADEANTGLPTTPQAPGAPWIMRPGTASAHIMVVQPRPAEGE